MKEIVDTAKSVWVLAAGLVGLGIWVGSINIRVAYVEDSIEKHTAAPAHYDAQNLIGRNEQRSEWNRDLIKDLQKTLTDMDRKLTVIYQRSIPPGSSR